MKTGCIHAHVAIAAKALQNETKSINRSMNAMMQRMAARGFLKTFERE
jgi:hypothetical protein